MSSPMPRDRFLAELNDQIKKHRRLNRWDAALYQFLVIGAAIAGFGSLAAGLYGNAIFSGIIGGLTGVATILSQQLHCVRAINWHYRIATELEGIRSKLVNENVSIHRLSKERRELELQMVLLWEITSKGSPPALGQLLRHNGRSQGVKFD